MSNLFDIDQGARLLETDELKKIKPYPLFDKVNTTVTKQAVFRKLHKFIDSQKPSQSSQLTWFRLAKVIGDTSDQQHKDIKYIEDVILKTVGNGKAFLQLAGLLLLIAVSERPEKYWLTSKTAETEKFDRDTGKPIEWRGYWINKNFVVPSQYKKHSLDDLVSRFNRK